MAMYINTNLASMNAQRNLASSQADMQTSIQRLSSGLRVNSAKDDAAGLAISSRMDSQIRGMSQAMRNANDGISLAQTADGAYATTVEALQRMRELTVQAASSSNEGESANITKEFTALQDEIKRIGSDTKFNGKAIIGADAGAFNVFVGSNSNDTTIDVTTTDMAAGAGMAAVLGTGLLSDAATANTTLAAIDTALDEVNGLRSDMGASQNRLGYAVSNLQTSVENQSAAKSRIVDADFAAETAKMSRNQILQQAGTAMLAQANQLPNQVMSLLRG